jgi:hypothetical protein
MKRARSAPPLKPSIDDSIQLSPPSFFGLRLLGDPSFRLFGRVCDHPTHLFIVTPLLALPSDKNLFAALGLESGSTTIFRRGANIRGTVWVEIECGSARAATKASRLPLRKSGSSSGGGSGGGSGVAAWLSASRTESLPTARELQASADAALMAFDAGTATAASEKKTIAARMEADGFELVTRRTRIEGEEMVGTEMSAKARKKAAAGVSRADFYAFQKRSEKAEALGALRDAFAADRDKIKRIASSRTFRPL